MNKAEELHCKEGSDPVLPLSRRPPGPGDKSAPRGAPEPQHGFPAGQLLTQHRQYQLLATSTWLRLQSKPVSLQQQ